MSSCLTSRPSYQVIREKQYDDYKKEHWPDNCFPISGDCYFIHAPIITYLQAVLQVPIRKVASRRLLTSALRYDVCYSRTALSCQETPYRSLNHANLWANGYRSGGMKTLP